MLFALLISFAVAFLARVAVPWVRHGGWLVAALPAGLFLYFLDAGRRVVDTGAVIERVEWVPALGVAFTLRLDGFSWLFALIVTGIGTLVTVYAGAYFSHAPPRQRAAFLSLILLFMTAMLGTVLADDLVVLFLFWEATSLLSFALIGFHSARTEARKAALQSLIVTAGGGLALFAGILLIGSQFGTFSLSALAGRASDVAASPLVIPIMALALVGAFTKSAQVPFHFWLPAAMEAPTPASAYLHSATMVKLGVYLLARLDPVFAEVPAFGTTLLIVGSMTVVVAAVGAFAARGYKAILAQTTVASLGVLVVLVGIDGELAATAMVLFMLAHALYKAALFFAAGTTIHATHEGSLDGLHGLGHALPLTACGAGLAALSMAGLPPTFGFIAKEAIFAGQLSGVAGGFVIGAAWLGSVAFVSAAGIVALAPFYLRTPVPTPVHEGETPGLVAGPLLLGILGIAFGLAPGLVAAPVVAPAISALVGRDVSVSLALWHGLTPALGLSAAAIVAGVGAFAARSTIRARLFRASGVGVVLGDAAYKAVFETTLRVAAWTTRTLQNGDQHRYTSVVLVAVLIIVAAGFVATGAPLSLSVRGDRAFDPASFVVLVLMVVGALAAVRAPALVTAMIAVGVVGFGSALLYLMNGAPDLALTQFSVEVLVVVMFTALLLRLPDRTARTREPAERRRGLLLATGIGSVVFVALASMTQAPLDLRLSEYFSATSYVQAHGRNVVNVIIVDYRGLDTLGEISVVAFAAIAVWGLLRRRRATRRT